MSLWADGILLLWFWAHIVKTFNFLVEIRAYDTLTIFRKNKGNINTENAIQDTICIKEPQTSEQTPTQWKLIMDVILVYVTKDSIRFQTRIQKTICHINVYLLVDNLWTYLWVCNFRFEEIIVIFGKALRGVPRSPDFTVGLPWLLKLSPTRWSRRPSENHN